MRMARKQIAPARFPFAKGGGALGAFKYLRSYNHEHQIPFFLFSN